MVFMDRLLCVEFTFLKILTKNPAIAHLETIAGFFLISFGKLPITKQFVLNE